MHLLSVAGVICAGLQVYELATASLRKSSAYFGAALYVCGLVLFFWSLTTIRGRAFPVAYSRVLPKKIVTSGPYAWVRHPFYLAYSMTWMAGLVTTLKVMLIPTVIVMLAFYIDAVRCEEKLLFAGHLRDEYVAYKARIGIIGPKIGS